MKKWIWLFLFVFASTSCAKTHYLFQWGFGAGSFEDAGAFNINLGIQGNRHLFMARVNINGELLGDVLEDYGLVYHYVFTSDKLFLSAGSGFALVRREESHGLFNDSEFHGPEPGLPVEGQITWRPFRFIGIGLYGVMNFNAEKTCASMALNLQFGNLR